MTTSEATTYARALYEVLIDSALSQLTSINAALQGMAPTAADFAERLHELLGPDVLPAVRNTVLLMLRDGMLDELPQLLQTFERFRVSSARQVLSAEVISAIELTQEQRSRIERELRERHAEQLDLHFSVDPSLIGGLLIRVGDQVIDNSLRTRLSAVQRTMLGS